ncbi:MAG TPA: Npt1/Npt2 family nucleotide transporter [Polyangiaceae bacterium]|nr:Npt1/Npt2 family nucleotide transporter [Polyangiaceae bacterium]
MTEPQAAPDRRGPLDRLLGVFAEVKSGEGPTALLLSFGLFLLLAAYYVIKPVRDSLITGLENGAKYKSYMGAVIAVALLFAVPAYGAFAARVPRQRLLFGVSAFFISNLIGFFVASFIPGVDAGFGQLAYALVFFLWVGVFNMMIIAQFWSFAADVYTEEQGKRLFALVGLGASVGSAAGSVVTSFAKRLGTSSLLVVCAILLALSAAVTLWVNARESERMAAKKTDDSGKPDEPQAPRDRPSALEGFRLVVSERYLLLIALFTVVFTLCNTNGEYVKDELVAKLAADTGHAQGLDAAQIKDLRTALFSEFYGWVNVLGVVLQSFVVSRVVQFLGLKRAFFILPVIALFDAGAIALFPVWSFIRFGKIAENSVDYSLNNTLRAMLWLPTTRNMKYMAKQAIDTLFVRSGDVLSSVLVFVLADRMKMGVRVFGVVNLGLVAVWLVLARLIGSENQSMSDKAAKAAAEAEAAHGASSSAASPTESET